MLFDCWFYDERTGHTGNTFHFAGDVKTGMAWQLTARP